jgi:hypothetical protein
MEIMFGHERNPRRTLINRDHLRIIILPGCVKRRESFAKRFDVVLAKVVTGLKMAVGIIRRRPFRERASLPERHNQ